MKEIKTDNYMKKEAIWSLPGDPGLPPGVTQRDIDEQAIEPKENRVSNQEGESEIQVNWPEFSRWFEEGGESLPESLRIRTEPSGILIKYVYSDDNGEKDIRPIKIVDYKTNQTITDPYIMKSFTDYFEGKINKDIGRF